jgi:FtsZ-binding cell division protein ZapB
MMEGLAVWATGAFGALSAGLVAFLRTPKGRAFLVSFLFGKRAIDEQTSVAVSTSLHALQTALNSRAEEHARFIEEIADLRFEIAELRQADVEKRATIDGLRTQVEALQRENRVLRQMIKEVGS